MHNRIPNRLINESSPYLQQHAYNPVNWFPWCEEAFAKAKAENKPVLLSVGYATCHWCHVMAHESFEDQETADLMNALYVNIKLDREERPDIDSIYMDAIQLLTGQGGWPLNVFLTPDKKPYWGGTYFPPKPLHNRPSWKDVLYQMHQYFVQQHDLVQQQAEQLTQGIKQSALIGQVQSHGREFMTGQIDYREVAKTVLKAADREWGGFGAAPKFPSVFSIRFLLTTHANFGDEEALQHALLSLDKMYQGGIFDHLAGGFARYSTDRYWKVPHFEKMLYDNVQLMSNYCYAYALTHDEQYKKIVLDCRTFLSNEMKSGHLYYSAIDADSEGIEGKYYVWTKAEIVAILGPLSEAFCDYFEVLEDGNWEGNNILHVHKSLYDVAQRNKLTVPELEQRLVEAKHRLLSHRAKRRRPITDQKHILAWNALAVVHLLECALLLRDTDWASECLHTLDSLLVDFTIAGGELARIRNKEQSKLNACLEDYALLIQACIMGHKASGRANYLHKAKQLSEAVIKNFKDADSILFNASHQSLNDVLVNKKEIYDSVIPSANAVMCYNLYYLGTVYSEPSYSDQALAMLQYMKPMMEKHPNQFGQWLCCAMLHDLGKELCIVGDRPELEFVQQYQLKVNDAIVVLSADSTAFPILVDKPAKAVKNFYLCYNKSCLPAFDNWGDLENYIAENIGGE